MEEISEESKDHTLLSIQELQHLYCHESRASQLNTLYKPSQILVPSTKNLLKLMNASSNTIRDLLWTSVINDKLSSTAFSTPGIHKYISCTLKLFYLN